MYLKTLKVVDKLKEASFEDLPTVKKVMARIKNDECDSTTYQGVDLKKYDKGLTFLKRHHREYADLVQDCLRTRVKVQSVDLLTHALTILATHGWERSESTAFGYEALDSVCVRFLVPLENANVDCSLVMDEWDDLLDYAKRYLNLTQEDYTIIWWKIFSASDAKKWTNILSVVELLFCLSVSNGHLERVFSQLKLIKGETSPPSPNMRRGTTFSTVG